MSVALKIPAVYVWTCDRCERSAEQPLRPRWLGRVSLAVAWPEGKDNAETQRRELDLCRMCARKLP